MDANIKTWDDESIRVNTVSAVTWGTMYIEISGTGLEDNGWTSTQNCSRMRRGMTVYLGTDQGYVRLPKLTLLTVYTRESTMNRVVQNTKTASASGIAGRAAVEFRDIF